jgi:hypothetical protein
LRSDSGLSAATAGSAEGGGEKGKVLSHPVDSRATTATLPPVLVRAVFVLAMFLGGAGKLTRHAMGQSKTVDDDVLCWLGFTPDAILTSCKTGKGGLGWGRWSEVGG